MTNTNAGTTVNESTIARVAKYIAQPYDALWASIAHDLVGARLSDVAAELMDSAEGDPDPDVSATWRACAFVLAEDARQAAPTQPVARGLADVAQIVGEVSVVAGAARWAAGAVALHVRRALDRRRQEQLAGIEPSSLIELDEVPTAGKQVSR